MSKKNLDNVTIANMTHEQVVAALNARGILPAEDISIGDLRKMLMKAERNASKEAGEADPPKKADKAPKPTKAPKADAPAKVSDTSGDVPPADATTEDEGVVDLDAKLKKAKKAKPSKAVAKKVGLSRPPTRSWSIIVSALIAGNGKEVTVDTLAAGEDADVKGFGKPSKGGTASTIRIRLSELKNVIGGTGLGTVTLTKNGASFEPATKDIGKMLHDGCTATLKGTAAPKKAAPKSDETKAAA